MGQMKTLKEIINNKEAKFRNPRDYEDLGVGGVKYRQRKGSKKKEKKDDVLGYREGSEIEEAQLGTFKLNTGDVVSARMGKGYSFKGQKKMQPYSFTNRTQAQKHAEKVDGKVINPGRVFYVKVKEEVEIEEGFFKVIIPEMNPTFIEASAVSAVKNDLRRKLKPEVFKELSIERVTVGEMKKMYRDMAQGKEVEEEVEIDEEVFYWYIIKGTSQKGKVWKTGTERQMKLLLRKPTMPTGYVLTKSRKDLSSGDVWKGSMGVSEEVEKRTGPPRITNMWKREEVEVEEGSEKSLDALRTALAKSKFKKAGGKVEKQPPGIARGALKFRGKGGTTRDDDEEDKINRDVMAWRKLRAARKGRK